jgi:hypothetical protein
VVRCRSGHLFTTIWIPGRVGQIGPVRPVASAALPGRRARSVRGALCAVHGPWGSEKATCRNHPPSAPAPSPRAAPSQRVRTASAARPTQQRAARGTGAPELLLRQEAGVRPVLLLVVRSERWAKPLGTLASAGHRVRSPLSAAVPRRPTDSLAHLSPGNFRAESSSNGRRTEHRHVVLIRNGIPWRLL